MNSLFLHKVQWWLLVCLLGMTPTIRAQDIEEATESQALPSYIRPTEIRRGLPMGGTQGKSREQLYYEGVIKKMEPDLVAKPDRLSQYIELFRREVIFEPRLFPFDVQATLKPDGTVHLTGFVGYEENRRALSRFLFYLGFKQVQDDIEVLPSKRLGQRQYAFIRVPHAFTYDKPQAPHEPMTQGLLGDPVFLLKKAEGGHFLCFTGEGYVGYIAGEHILRVTQEDFTRYQQGPQAYFLKDFSAGDSFFVPMGARLKWESREAGQEVLLLPTGSRLRVPSSIVEVHQGQTDPRIARAVEVATQMLSARYVWSGKTSQGVDCSGLVQSSFKALGMNLPRDAYQQAYLGSLVATRWYRDGLRPGDLLYFLGRNGKIHHTAIYVGQEQYLEASGRDVHYTSFNPRDPNYSKEKDLSFCFAKRLLE